MCDVQLEGFVLSGRVAVDGSQVDGSQVDGSDVDGSNVSGTESTYVELGGERALEATRAAVGHDGTFRFVRLVPGTYELRWSMGRVASVSIDAREPIALEVQRNLQYAGTERL